MKSHACRASAARPRAAVIEIEEPAKVEAVEVDVELEGELLDAPVDLNLASVAELRSLPGIGPTLAARIVESRAERGPFLCVADLGTVQGITPKLLAKLEKRVTVGPASRHPPMSYRGSLVPWRGDGLVLHGSRSREAPVTRGPWLLPPASCDPEEMELRDEELEEVAADHAAVANDVPASGVRRSAHAQTPVQQPIVIEELAEPPTPRWKRFAGVVGLALVAAAACFVYFGNAPGYARQTDVEGLASEVRELQADRQQVRGRLERIEPVSEELPRTAAQIDALNARLQEQEKDSTKQLVEAQATVRRLKREVGILRDAIHHEQKKSEALMRGGGHADARTPMGIDDDAGRNALARSGRP